MSLKDIEKLKERVDKDPNSKLFVPLAEEYKKEGMLDEAISVLLGGIDRQPGYMSARVSLGKIYLDKGMLNEARSEFENVIKSIPDNLYAHKKLAEIYRDTGEKDLSIRSYRAVLSLNALDDDAISNLRELEEGEEGIEQLEAAGELISGADAEPTTSSIQEQLGEAVAEETGAVSEAAPPQHSEEELNAFKDSIFGDKSAAAPAIEETEEISAEDEIEVVEDVSDQEEISFEDIAQDAEEISIGEPLQAEELSVDDSIDAEEISFEEAAEAVELAVSNHAEISGDSGVAKAASFAGKSAENVSSVSRAEGAGARDADGMIASGNYLGAMNAYRQMLASNPDDRAVLQRIEELRVLMKLMGKDKEILISKLDGFLEGVRRRRDEFYRSS